MRDTYKWHYSSRTSKRSEKKITSAQTYNPNAHAANARHRPKRPTQPNDDRNLPETPSRHWNHSVMPPRWLLRKSLTSSKTRQPSRKTELDCVHHGCSLPHRVGSMMVPRVRSTRLPRVSTTRKYLHICKRSIMVATPWKLRSESI